jgi:hypothetical protein
MTPIPGNKRTPGKCWGTTAVSCAWWDQQVYLTKVQEVKGLAIASMALDDAMALDGDAAVDDSGDSDSSHSARSEGSDDPSDSVGGFNKFALTQGGIMRQRYHTEGNGQQMKLAFFPAVFSLSQVAVLPVLLMLVLLRAMCTSSAPHVRPLSDLIQSYPIQSNLI